MTKFITNLPSDFKFSSNSLDLVDIFFDDFNLFFTQTFPDFTKTEFEKGIEGYPVANAYTNKEGDLRFEIAVTGFKENEVSAFIKDGFLIVKAEKKVNEAGADEWKMISGRLKKSSFEKRYRLSNKLNLDKVNAKVEDGVLSIEIKAKEDSKPKLIDITFSK